MKYDEVFTYKNLYNAHLKARKSKRHKKDVILFEMDLNNNLYELKKKLDDRTYKVSGYNKFIIYEPKRREIQSLNYFYRVVQHCIVDNYLMPLLDRHLIYDNGIVFHNDKEYLNQMLFKFLGFNYSFNSNGKILKLLSSKRKSLILKKVKRSESINTVTSYKGYLLNSNNYYFYERVSKLDI